MKNAEKLRIRRVKIQQKAAKTSRKASAYASTLNLTGPELGLAIARFMTPRQLKHVLASPQRFDRDFPGADLPRLAQSELFDRKLDLKEE